MNLNPLFEPQQPPRVPPSQRPKFTLSRIFWAGLILLLLGTGPLEMVILLAQFGVTKDPNPNPIGVGLLALLTFWPSIILMIVGGATSYFRYKSGSQRKAVRQSWSINAEATRSQNERLQMRVPALWPTH